MNLQKMMIYFILIFTMYSCGLIKQDVVKREYYNRNFYYNDSIKVGVKFHGAIDFFDLTDVTKKGLRRNLKGIRHPNLNRLFIYANAWVPNVDFFFFYEQMKDSASYERIIIQDSLRYYSWIEKQRGRMKISLICKNSFDTERAFEILNRVSIDSLDQRIQFYNVYYNYVMDNDLTLIDKIKRNPLSKNKKNGGLENDFLIAAHSLISNNPVYDSLISEYEINLKKRNNLVIEELAQKKKIVPDNSALETIGQLAEKNQLIVLNEDFRYPKHRVFASKLLDALKYNGVKYLSIPAFIESKDTLTFWVHRPNDFTSVFLGSSYFKHFIDKAKKLEFMLIGSESSDVKQNRIMKQVENMHQILLKDPNARIFIYAGYDTFQQSNQFDLITELKRKLGITPIIIDQGTIIADYSKEIGLIPKEDLSDAIKQKSKADFFVINNIQSNLQMVYPSIPLIDLEITDRKFEEKKELLVSIYEVTKTDDIRVFIENIDTLRGPIIPVLTELVIPTHGKIKLKLPKGKYHIKVQATNEKRPLYYQKILVE